ncbi:hypothetical protein J2R76_000057 [Bradyrhizobium sp. USDA 4532]|uniref:hypothetical protein n=1 Tax=unclassified Bradyrhizobium TaxID=2631580 RepID=UPI0020A0FE56|nr:MULTISPECIES: hypothetical protein [unclassified Bradyrhizobium]MCP1831629.1 hypothetical protein [Bradyrhizobium sp. USDA 4545]MCP1916466.1 hypothetical protein [Bradyrhizobium sp. USDA 4532]
MERTPIAEFDTRRATELAVEHAVQECGVQMFVQPTGADNTSGDRPAGVVVKTAPRPEQGGKLEGPIEVSVDFHGDNPKRVADVLTSAGAKAIRTK